MGPHNKDSPRSPKASLRLPRSSRYWAPSISALEIASRMLTTVARRVVPASMKGHGARRTHQEKNTKGWSSSGRYSNLLHAALNILVAELPPWPIKINIVIVVPSARNKTRSPGSRASLATVRNRLALQGSVDETSSTAHAHHDGPISTEQETCPSTRCAGMIQGVESLLIWLVAPV